MTQRGGSLSLERHGRKVHFAVPDGASIPYVYRPIPSGKWYEETFLEHVRSVGRRGVYVDVGAHLGTHTLWFALLCPSTIVHAIEPVERYADVIHRNVEANALQDRVVVHRVGVSDRSGTSSNYLSMEHQIGFEERAEGRVETFPVVRLDELIRGVVAVIKADVEGMEPLVLAGAARILLRHRPLVYAEARTSAEFDRLAAVVADFGYLATGRVFNASPTYEFAPSKGRIRTYFGFAARKVVRRARRRDPDGAPP